MNYYSEKFISSEIIVYLRKSRSDDPLMSVEEVLAKHMAILQDWVDKNLDSPIPDENIYREVVSGETIDGRPEMLKVLKRIENPRIKAVLVVEPQRLSRGDLEDCGRLMKLLRFTGTYVITPQKTYDLTNEYDREFFEHELKRGNDYLEYFKKIQNRGRLQSVASGNYVGSIPPYGFDKTYVMDGKRKCPTLAFNDNIKFVQMIFDLFVNEHLGLVAIAHKLDAMGVKAPKGNHWSYISLRGIIANPHYNGKVVWNRRATVKSVEDMEVRSSRPRNNDYLCYDGRHPKAIDDITFRKAQKLLGSSPRQNYNNRGLTNMLSGILYCECGRCMNMRTYSEPGGKLKSSARFVCPDQSNCNNGSVLAEDLLRSVFVALCQELNNYEVKAANSEKVREESQNVVSMLGKQLAALEKKRIALWDKYTDEAMPQDVFEQLREKCEADIQQTKKALDEAYKDVPDYVSLKNAIYTFKQASRCIYDDSMAPAEKNVLLKAAMKKITYTRPRPVRNTNSKKSTGKRNGWVSADPEISIQFQV